MSVGRWIWMGLAVVAAGCGTRVDPDLAESPVAAVPVEQLRGVHEEFGVDDDKAMIVRAPVEAVARAISEKYHATDWKRDTQNRPVELAERSVFVGRLRGHDWSFVAASGEPLTEGVVSDASARELSKALKTQAVILVADDTSGSLYYQVFHSGRSLEQLEWDGRLTRFRSRIDGTTAEDLEQDEDFDPIERLHEYLASEDAYIASAYGSPASGGSYVVFEVVGASTNDFARVDYLLLP
jgi:hypothetical protein